VSLFVFHNNAVSLHLSGVRCQVSEEAPSWAGLPAARCRHTVSLLVSRVIGRSLSAVTAARCEVLLALQHFALSARRVTVPLGVQRLLRLQSRLSPLDVARARLPPTSPLPANSQSAARQHVCSLRFRSINVCCCCLFF